MHVYKHVQASTDELVIKYRDFMKIVHPWEAIQVAND
jgi:hypothetical protein